LLIDGELKASISTPDRWNFLGGFLQLSAEFVGDDRAGAAHLAMSSSSLVPLLQDRDQRKIAPSASSRSATARRAGGIVQFWKPSAILAATSSGRAAPRRGRGGDAELGEGLRDF